MEENYDSITPKLNKNNELITYDKDLTKGGNTINIFIFFLKKIKYKIKIKKK